MSSNVNDRETGNTRKQPASQASSSTSSTRRDFLKQTAMTGVGVGVWVAMGRPAWAEEGQAGGSNSPNEKLNIACIGVGGKGDSDSDQAANYGNIVAICDVDENTLNKRAEKEAFKNAKRYSDFRKMFDEMGKGIDAVTVSTADHTHAAAAGMAIKMGKHVYVQKPLTHNVWEARRLRELANEHKVATQMGNQGTADNGLRRGVEVIRAGAVGPVKEVHVWTNRPIWPQAPQVTERPKETPPVPPSLNWDAWLGPAPERPYHPLYHPFAWRGWWDFGTGALGDMACHTANLPFMALGLGYPTSVVADATHVNEETYPSSAHIIWEFPEREVDGQKMPPVTFHWYEGRRDEKKVLPPLELFQGQEIVDSGSLMVGEKGVMYSPSDYGTEYKLLPEKNFEGFQGPPEKLPRNGGGDEGMKREWIEAAKAGKPEMALSNFNYSAVLTEAILLGNVAIRMNGQKLEWDGPNLKITNNADANKWIKREYRQGWEL